jgi:hypothetical protein
MAVHTDIPTRDDVIRLLRVRAPWCVSIYLATSPISAIADGNPIELKNLAASAVEQLEAAGTDKGDVAAIADELGDLVDDDEFWSRQANSLAIFATPAAATTFRLPNRLAGMVEVSDRFHLKPLLRAVTFPQAAYVLALAQGSVRLVEIASDVAPAEVAVTDLPTDAASAVGKASITDRTASGRIQGTEGQKVRMRQYARRVDEALRPLLTGDELPLILAATEPLDAIFRSVCSYPRLAAATIPGSPGGTPDAELAASARTILDGLYADELADVRALYQARSDGDRASSDIARVARAATYGAVHTLLADIDAVVPGSIDEDSGDVTLDEHDDAVNYGVIDEIARRVLLAGGRVLAVRSDDIPENAPLAAIFRYAI